MLASRKVFVRLLASLVPWTTHIAGASLPPSATTAKRSPFDPPKPASSTKAKISAGKQQAKALPVVPFKVSASASASRAMGPTTFQAQRVARLWSEIKVRPSPSADARAPRSVEIVSAANKQDWLKQAYSKGIVDASHVSYMLADKLMFYEILKLELGEDVDRFYPKTLGLKRFLEMHQLVDAQGRLTAEPDALEQALADEFPYGYVARPSVGVAPQETVRGLFAKSDQIVAEIFSGKSAIYSPASFRAPIASHILGGVASGEAVVLQEDVILRADAHRKLKSRSVAEARVHTYEAKAVPGSTPDLWSATLATSVASEDQVRRAEAFVGEFLGRLSTGLTARQAWRVDVAALDNGDLRILDIVTNRGSEIAWSSYLEQPRVIGAYSRFWEDRCGAYFAGPSGSILRHGLANYFPYWSKRMETAKTPWRKAVAMLPPIP